jgi:hypothetical protein
VAGMHTIHESSNENGRMFGQFATRNIMLIKSTVYPHKRIHLGTWKIPGTNEEVNQIDHVLVSKRHSSSINDVRSCRGPNCNSDHHLVKVRVQEKLANIQKMVKIRKKWDADKLIKQPEVREEYESKLQMRL